jgi:xanthine dehydrogenase YagT iron-sulfur-binding subunit
MAEAPRERPNEGIAPEQAIEVEVGLCVNGEERSLVVDTRTSLLDLLRERLGLTGAKKGCDHGQCGACTVLLDGRRVNACLLLAVACSGADVVTVEGLATNGDLTPLQLAFVEHDAFQCGYCTPGQICSATGMLRELADGWPSAAGDGDREAELTESEVRERMNGNICRCGAYPNLVAAILAAGT